MLNFENYINNALEFCLHASKEYTKHQDIINCLKTQNCMLHSKFRYSIAKDIAAFLLKRYGESIKNLNLYGSTMEYTAGIYSDIDLILHVKTFNSEMKEILNQINNLLSEKYYQLLNKDKSEWSYLIDAHIIHDEVPGKHQPSLAYLEYILKNNSVALC